MDLLKPGTGLLFWQLIVFVGLCILLAKYAWKPILASLNERETTIQQALDSAEKARTEMASLKSDNEKLLKQTREERDRILKDARDAAGRLHDQAQADARKNADKILEEAKAAIQTEKQAALRDVRAQVALFSIEIAEKLIKKDLSSDASQKQLVEGYLKDLKIN
jgi:F-type H+-transporting ATPase subunit b